MYVRHILWLIEVLLLLKNAFAAPAAGSISVLNSLDTRNVSTSDESASLWGGSTLPDTPEPIIDGGDYTLEARSTDPYLIRSCTSLQRSHFLESKCTTSTSWTVTCADNFRHRHTYHGSCQSGYQCQNLGEGSSTTAQCYLPMYTFDCEIHDPDCECYRIDGKYNVMACGTPFSASARSLPPEDQAFALANLEPNESANTADQRRDIASVTLADGDSSAAEDHVHFNEAHGSSLAGLMKRENYIHSRHPMLQALQMVGITNVAAGVSGIIMSKFPKSDALKFVTGVKGVFKKAVKVSGIAFAKGAKFEIRWDWQPKRDEGDYGIHCNMLIQEDTKRQTWGIYFPQDLPIVKDVQVGYKIYQDLITELTKLHFNSVIKKIIANQEEQGNAIVDLWREELESEG